MQIIKEFFVREFLKAFAYRRVVMMFEVFTSTKFMRKAGGIMIT